jgi:hypothetical protein
MLDTYEAVKQLKATGLTEEQAGAVVKVVNSTGDKLATKADLTALQAATKADLESLQMATQADLKALQTTTQADLKAGLLDLQVKLMATQIAVAALIVAAIKLF